MPIHHSTEEFYPCQIIKKKKKKKEKKRATVDSEGFDYFPFVVESFGDFSKGVIPFLNKLTSCIPARFSVENSICSKLSHETYVGRSKLLFS